MNHYVTGTAIKLLREHQHMTQAELAEKLSVSNKAVSRWETCRGFPDITLLEPLSNALGVSVTELLSGDCVTNRNVSGNMVRSQFYVCPICGNILHTMGEAVISCCGVTLPPLDAEEPDSSHMPLITPIVRHAQKHSEPLQEPSASTVDILQGLTDRETAYELHCLLHRLEEPYKEVFWMRTFGELSFREIARIFGKSEGWARVVYHRARTKLKEELL